MNLNDYILEGMSDIDVSDIEITQAFAEMAVLEAMMNCYEKQMVLLEYNEESADEIFTESFMPDFIQEARIEYKTSRLAKGWKIVHDTDGGKKDKNGRNYGLWYLYGVDENGLEVVFGPYNSRQELLFNARDNKLARKGYGKHNIEENKRRIQELKAKIQAGKAEEEAAPASVTPTVQENPAPNSGKSPKNGPGTEFQYNSPGEEYYSTNPEHLTGATGSMSSKDIQAYNKRSTFAKKSFANSLDRFFARAGYVIKKVVATIIDLFTNINWDKYKKALEKKLDSTNEDSLFLTKAEFNAISAMTYVDDKVVEFKALFTVEYFKNKNWTVGLEKQEVGKINAYINDIKKYVASPDQYTDKDASTSISQAEIIQMVDTLSSNKSKKTIREMQKAFAKFNIDENPNSGIPASVGVAMRKLLDLLAKYYTKTSAAFKKMINKIVDDKEFDDVKLRDQNSNINFELGGKGLRDEEERSGKNPATHRNFGRSIQKSKSDETYLPSDENTKGVAAAWSMNLDEDADFF